MLALYVANLNLSPDITYGHLGTILSDPAEYKGRSKPWAPLDTAPNQIPLLQL